MRQVLTAGLVAGGVAFSTLLAPGVATATERKYDGYKHYDITVNAYPKKHTYKQYGYGYKVEHRLHGSKYVGYAKVQCKQVYPVYVPHQYTPSTTPTVPVVTPKKYECKVDSWLYKKDRYKKDHRGAKVGKLRSVYSYTDGDNTYRGKVVQGYDGFKHAYGYYTVQKKHGHDAVRYYFKVPHKP